LAVPPFKIGATLVTVLNLGDFAINLYDIFGKDTDLSRYFDPKELATPPFMPSNTILIESGRRKVLVDPGDHQRLISAYGAQPPNAPAAPPPLSEQLGAAGVDLADIDTVVITHLHYDHFAGVTRMVGGRTVPSFPSARYIIPKKDWEMAEIADSRNKGDKDLAETLGVLEREKLLSFLDGAQDLGGGVTITPSPGESPGHQTVCVESGGATCYCVGDLYHLREEVEHPELVAAWADRLVLLQSRNAFSKRASRETALVVPGHMRPGRIRLRGGTPVWS